MFYQLNLRFKDFISNLEKLKSVYELISQFYSKIKLIINLNLAKIRDRYIQSVKEEQLRQPPVPHTIKSPRLGKDLNLRYFSFYPYLEEETDLRLQNPTLDSSDQLFLEEILFWIIYFNISGSEENRESHQSGDRWSIAENNRE